MNSFNLTLNSDQLNYLDSNFYKYRLEILARAERLPDEKKKQLGFSLSEMLFLCKIGVSICNESDFEWFYDIFYGNCFKFNSGKNMKGEEIELKVSDSINILENLQIGLFLPKINFENSISSNIGLHIIISNQNFIVDFNEGFDILTGAESLISISKTVVHQIPKPFSKCTLDLNEKRTDYQFYDEFKKINKTYSKRDCESLCLQELIIDKCNCSIPNYYTFGRNETCYLPIHFACFFKFLKKKNNETVYKNCSDKCEFECQKEMYSVSISSSLYPSKSLYENWLKNLPNVKEYAKNSTYESMKSHFAIMSFYIPDLKYLSIKEIKNVPLTDLVANLGNL